MSTAAASPGTSTAALGRTVRSRSILAHDRLDAAFFADPAVAVTEQIAVLEASGVPVIPLGALARIRMPPRLALVRATAREPSVPYLRPYDVFDYLPTAADRVSVTRNPALSTLRFHAGIILQTRSGRNLGPCTLADDDLAGFAVSDDMVRIEITDDVQRDYVVAYLQTPLGQALLRRGRSGSVIDHLTVADVAAVPVPTLPHQATEAVAALMRNAAAARAAGRRQLRAVLAALTHRLPPPEEPATWGSWTSQSSALTDRLDAAHHSPTVQKARKQLAAAGGLRLGDLAAATLPVRYKRYYVTGDYGRPIVSGRQLLQIEPINLRRVSDRSFRDAQDYEIHTGMTVFGAVGRAEGRQAWPALVTAERDGWLASNDVMRLVPRANVRPGAVWLGVASAQAQTQIKALSFGSVVDHMNPWDVEDVLIPTVSDSDADAAEDGWDALTTGTTLAHRAVAELQAHLDAAELPSTFP